MEKKDIPQDRPHPEAWCEFMEDSIVDLSASIRMHSRFLTFYTIALIAAVCAGIIFL